MAPFVVIVLGETVVGVVSGRTTVTAILDAISCGDAREYDLGFAFSCTAVSSSVHAHGTPIG